MSAKQARFAGRHSFVQRLRTPPGHWINAAKPNGGSDAVAMEPAVRQAGTSFSDSKQRCHRALDLVSRLTLILSVTAIFGRRKPGEFAKCPRKRTRFAKANPGADLRH